MTISRRGLALASAASILTGCFSYVPTELGTVREGEAVQVFLTREGMRQLDDDLEAADLALGAGGSVVRGTLVRWNENEVYVQIPRVTRQVGFYSDIIGQHIAIPRSEIVQAQRRELNPLKTSGLAAGTAGLVGAVVYLIITDARQGEQRPDDSAPVDLRIPFLSLRLP